MIPAHFKIAVGAMKFQSKEKVQAAYLVICHQWPVRAAAKRYNTSESSLSRATNAIRRKWQKMHTKKALLCEPVSLTPDEMATVRQLEDKHIHTLQEQSKKWNHYELDDIQWVGDDHQTDTEINQPPL